MRQPTLAMTLALALWITNPAAAQETAPKPTPTPRKPDPAPEARRPADHVHDERGDVVIGRRVRRRTDDRL
jgi:hypothetical protein